MRLYCHVIYFKYRDACSISMPFHIDIVIITGGSFIKTGNKVSIYDKDGWFTDLPELKVGRYGHGCTTYGPGGEQVRLTI